jgi:glucose/arabinose dehydrogenase
LRRTVLLTLVLILIGVGCGGDDDDEANEIALSPTSTQEANPSQPGNATEEPEPTEDDNPTGDPGQIQLTPIFSLSEFSGRPVDLDPIPEDDGRYLALDQEGFVVLLDESVPDQALEVADLRDRVNDEGTEEGLLGLAFAPDWEESNNIYLYYTAAGPRRSVLSRFVFDGETIDIGAEQVLLEVEQPFPNHNGGALEFGPDGFLYLGLGDGGSVADPMGNGQDGNLLGSILRLDVSGDQIAIPEDNPFADGSQGFEPETFAYGFRNPWRFSFDRDSGQLWVADVGQRRFEEVDVVESGANYGWNIMEGPECFQPEEGCDQTGLELPVAWYGHDEGCSITGGYVYRGQEVSGLNGWYLYSDFCSGRIWALSSEDPSQVVVLLDSGLPVASFAEDGNGELFLLAFDGVIYRVTPA